MTSSTGRSFLHLTAAMVIVVSAAAACTGGSGSAARAERPGSSSATSTSTAVPSPVVAPASGIDDSGPTTLAAAPAAPVATRDPEGLTDESRLRLDGIRPVAPSA